MHFVAAGRRVVAHTYGPMRYIQSVFSIPVIPIAKDMNRAMDMDKVGLLSNHIVISDKVLLFLLCTVLLQAGLSSLCALRRMDMPILLI
jgi:hypothetical protein